MSTYQVEPDELRATEAYESEVVQDGPGEGLLDLAFTADDVGTLAGADGGDATTFDAPEEG